MTLTNARGAFCVVLALACWQLTGCSQWRYNFGQPLAHIDLPQPEQQVSLKQALDLFGPPQRMSAANTGYILAWEYWRIKEDSLGVRLGAFGAEFMSADWGDMRASGEFVLLTFNRQHMLTGAQRSQWDNHGGGGKAIQPFMGLVSVVDAGDLTDRSPQHRWGGAFLRALPKALNNASNPDTGQNGIEQRGTPATAGQKSLEMH